MQTIFSLVTWWDIQVLHHWSRIRLTSYSCPSLVLTDQKFILTEFNLSGQIENLFLQIKKQNVHVLSQTSNKHTIQNIVYEIYFIYEKQKTKENTGEQ